MNKRLLCFLVIMCLAIPSALSWSADRKIEGSTITITVDTSGTKGYILIETLPSGVAATPDSAGIVADEQGGIVGDGYIQWTFTANLIKTLTYTVTGTGAITGKMTAGDPSSTKDVTGDLIVPKAAPPAACTANDWTVSWGACSAACDGTQTSTVTKTAGSTCTGEEGKPAVSTQSCGTCPAGQTCTNNVCIPGCTPQCTGKQCGSDGCGGNCGSCGDGEICDATGKCAVSQPTCVDSDSMNTKVKNSIIYDGKTYADHCTFDNKAVNEYVCVDSVSSPVFIGVTCAPGSCQGGVCVSEDVTFDLRVDEMGAGTLAVKGNILEYVDICVENIGGGDFSSPFEVNVISKNANDEAFDSIDFNVTGVTLEAGASCENIGSFFPSVKLDLNRSDISLTINLDPSNALSGELTKSNNLFSGVASYPSEKCTDSFDNDGDGLVDCLDSDCSGCPSGQTCSAAGACEVKSESGSDAGGDGTNGGAKAAEFTVDAGTPEKQTLLQNIINALDAPNKSIPQKISAIAKALRDYLKK